jgi:hypothetical protein
MTKRTKTMQVVPAFLAAVLLVLANSSHIHLRYCLDGDEAPISIHFETENSHQTVSNEIAVDELKSVDQADIESELSLDSLLAKISKTPTDFQIISAYELPDFNWESQVFVQLHEREILPDSPDSLQPPSRAPPAIA